MNSSTVSFEAKAGGWFNLSRKLGVVCIAVGAMFLTGLSMGQAKGGNPLDAKAGPYIERYNKTLPAMVAATLRQERSTVVNGVVTLAYTEVTKTSAQLTAMNLPVTQRPYIFPAICQTPETGKLLREGYSFRYMYFGKDGKLAATLTFAARDCT